MFLYCLVKKVLENLEKKSLLLASQKCAEYFNLKLFLQVCPEFYKWVSFIELSGGFGRTGDTCNLFQVFKDLVDVRNVFCSVKRNALSFVATRTRAGTNRALVGHSKTSYVNLNNITSGGFIA